MEEVEEGDTVLGQYEGYKYPGVVEKKWEIEVNGETGKKEKVKLYIVHWKGYKGKKAMSILRKCEIEKTSEKEKIKEAKEELAVTINIGKEIFEKQEFVKIYELFILPDKLKNMLIDMEEEIVEEKIARGGEMTVEECMEIWDKEKKYLEIIINIFNQNIFNFIYAYEKPYIQKLKKDKPFSQILGAVYLVRMLSVFPEIISSFARHKNICVPTKKTMEEDVDFIFEQSRMFHSLCHFLVSNFGKIFDQKTDQPKTPTGLYYLQRTTAAPASAPTAVHHSGQDRKWATGQKTGGWKRKKPNHLVRIYGFEQTAQAHQDALKALEILSVDLEERTSQLERLRIGYHRELSQLRLELRRSKIRTTDPVVLTFEQYLRSTEVFFFDLREGLDDDLLACMRDAVKELARRKIGENFLRRLASMPSRTSPAGPGSPTSGHGGSQEFPDHHMETTWNSSMFPQEEEETPETRVRTAMEESLLHGLSVEGLISTLGEILLEAQEGRGPNLALRMQEALYGVLEKVRGRTASPSDNLQGEQKLRRRLKTLEFKMTEQKKEKEEMKEEFMKEMEISNNRQRTLEEQLLDANSKVAKLTKNRSKNKINAFPDEFVVIDPIPVRVLIDIHSRASTPSDDVRNFPSSTVRSQRVQTDNFRSDRELKLEQLYTISEQDVRDLQDQLHHLNDELQDVRAELIVHRSSTVFVSHSGPAVSTPASPSSSVGRISRQRDEPRPDPRPNSQQPQSQPQSQTQTQAQAQSQSQPRSQQEQSRSLSSSALSSAEAPSDPVEAEFIPPVVELQASCPPLPESSWKSVEVAASPVAESKATEAVYQTPTRTPPLLQRTQTPVQPPADAATGDAGGGVASVGVPVLPRSPQTPQQRATKLLGNEAQFLSRWMTRKFGSMKGGFMKMTDASALSFTEFSELLETSEFNTSLSRRLFAALSDEQTLRVEMSRLPEEAELEKIAQSELEGKERELERRFHDQEKKALEKEIHVEKELRHQFKNQVVQMLTQTGMTPTEDTPAPVPPPKEATVEVSEKVVQILQTMNETELRLEIQGLGKRLKAAKEQLKQVKSERDAIGNKAVEYLGQIRELQRESLRVPNALTKEIADEREEFDLEKAIKDTEKLQGKGEVGEYVFDAPYVLRAKLADSQGVERWKQLYGDGKLREKKKRINEDSRRFISEVRMMSSQALKREAEEAEGGVADVSLFFATGSSFKSLAEETPKPVPMKTAKIFHQRPKHNSMMNATTTSSFLSGNSTSTNLLFFHSEAPSANMSFPKKQSGKIKPPIPLKPFSFNPSVSGRGKLPAVVTASRLLK